MAGTSYTRQSTLTDGDTITASLFNAEYNQLVTAFSYASTGTTGHQHDGGAGEGGNIEIIGDQDFLNKIVVDSTNNRWSVFVEVGGSAVEQVRIEDGVVYPVTDSDVDLGTNALRFKDAYIDSLTATGNLTVGGNITVTGNVDVDGIIEFDGLSGTGAVTVTDILDQDDMSSDSATALATQQSIKAYVDAQQDTVDTFAEILALSNTSSGTDVELTTTDKVQFRDSAIYINSSVDGQLDIVADTEIQIAATTIDINGAVDMATTLAVAGNVDFNGDLDVDGTTNLDVVDIDGAVQADGTITVGVDDTGYDVKFFGATTGKSLLWDESADSLIVTGNSTVSGTLGVTGVLTGTSLDISGDIDVDGVTNLDVVDIDGAVDMASTLTVASNIVVGGTVDGRDVATDGTKLDGIEASATADQTDAEIRTAVEAATDSNVFTDADHTKLNAIEALADVTDTTNVTAAGALMDSEVTNLAEVKAFDSTDYATAAQGTLADAALPKTGGAMTGAITTNSTFDGRDVSVDGTKLDGVEASADVTDTANVTAAGALMDSELTSIASVKALNQGVATGDSPTFVNVTATSLDISGDIDVDGTTNLDVVDIDGAVDFASTTAHAGNATFADNAKAIFGAGSDLQIYHDGSNSYIQDQGLAGTGNLILAGADVEITTFGGSKYFQGASNVARLYHTNNEKLATTAIGIDVTGTVTADGLLVEGETAGQGASIEVHATTTEFGDALLIAKSDNASNSIHAGVKIQGSNNPFYIYQSNGSNTNKLRFNYNSMSDAGGQMTIASNGDISFYEDTGTTPKFSWSSANETISIGLGASSTATISAFSRTVSASLPSALRIIENTGASTYWDIGSDGGASPNLKFYVNANTTPKVTFTSSGNVGIGAASPVDALDITRPSGTASRIRLLQTGYDSWQIGMPAANAAFTFANSGTERMRIDSSGNVGIGTSSPISLLTVNNNGEAFITIRSSDTGNAGIQFGDQSDSVQGAIYQNATDNSLRFNGYNNSEAMRIDSSGNVIIASTGGTLQTATAGTST
jgi:cytoskeletal protein CcmA (bactofilin family)